MARPNYNDRRRVQKPETQEEIDIALGGAGKFVFALVFHLDGSISTFVNREGSSPTVHGPHNMRDNPNTGELEEEVPNSPGTYQPFPVKKVIMSQTIQVLTVERNPICKVIVYPDGSKVHYHLP
jgi:hypothetical protein